MRMHSRQDGIIHGVIVQAKHELGETVDREETCAADSVCNANTYALPADAGAWSAFVVAGLFGIALVCIQCAVLCAVLVSLEVCYEVDLVEAPRVVVGQVIGNLKVFTCNLDSGGLPAPSIDKLLKVRLVCHPRWLLADTNLSNFIARSSSELNVLSEAEAQSAFPCGPLTSYEAVLKVPGSMPTEEVGRIMQALVEKRRVQCSEEPLTRRARPPRFQLIASNQWTFLHFGGSLGCGHLRWRSCPARLLSERCLSLRLTF